MSEDTTKKQYIHVRVKANAKSEKIYTHKDKFFVEIKENAKQGKANMKVKQLLSRKIGCNEKALRLIKGGTAPSKTFLIITS